MNMTVYRALLRLTAPEDFEPKKHDAENKSAEGNDNDNATDFHSAETAEAH